jgi:predicted pyridoxine 5'-phosphate oxidase superfamily flavin-nucleotide-binding protein
MEHPIFHAGEIAVQQRVGEEAVAARNGRAISDTIVTGALRFIENQPFVIVSSLDQAGQVWTSILSGENGYCIASDASTLEISLPYLCSHPADIFWENIQSHSSVGMLFIELSTRRRFRINGKVTLTKDQLRVKAQQAYPNCPKFIQSRYVNTGEKAMYTEPIQKGKVLNPELHSWIVQADTFFVGSSDPEGELDASHRGGAPGFVKVLDSSTLQIPDYQGNSMYNTLGNFVLNPKAGLLFIDFTQHRTLQLSGTVQIIWQDEEARQATGGTGRLWSFSIEEWIVLENLKNLTWHFHEYSPLNPT